MKLEYLSCGKIVNTHGFRGTVKLESWCDSPAILAGLKTLWIFGNGTYSKISVKHASVFKQFVLMDLEGIESEEAADRLRGTEVFAARSDLPIEEGSFFIAELLGLPVFHADTGEQIGTLTDVNTSGARDLYVIKTERGEFLIPAVPQFIVSIDLESGIRLRPIPGLLGEEE